MNQKYLFTPRVKTFNFFNAESTIAWMFFITKTTTYRNSVHPYFCK